VSNLIKNQHEFLFLERMSNLRLDLSLRTNDAIGLDSTMDSTYKNEGLSVGASAIVNSLYFDFIFYILLL
jgi:hypothetical protein